MDQSTKSSSPSRPEIQDTRTREARELLELNPKTARQTSHPRSAKFKASTPTARKESGKGRENDKCPAYTDGFLGRLPSSHIIRNSERSNVLDSAKCLLSTFALQHEHLLWLEKWLSSEERW